CEVRKIRGKKMSMRVIEDFPITLENVVKYAAGSKAIYKCHIMHALMDYGYTIDLYGDVYDSLFSAKDGLCSEIVRGEIEDYPEVKFVSQLIRSAGGIAVLAHPRVYDNFDLLEELAEDGLIDGVEAYHCSNSESEGDESRLLEIAEKYRLIVTGGSDFHGFYNHYPIPIGHYTTPSESLGRILRKKEVERV
ncbi:MAG: PHP domain-containing protein, partial [Oscillospiraceae bacterium]|nr:PHP domain-containing protein [Oscillospiraceae bacterium]